MKTINNRYEYDPGKDFLGKGGFARVYRARDTLLHREVALKLFNNNGDQRYSVLEEIRKAIGLEHPNLLRYYDVVLQEGENQFGEIEQTQIGIMELANAGDLKDFARNNPGSPLLYKLLKEVLQGLEYLHGKGIIHRDLKAQNILLVKQDGQLTAKISDFGISKDTAAGGQSASMMAGTLAYMAPEQFAPAKYGIDGKIASNLDLWSFGIMVHELLTDSSPFGSRDGDTTIEQIMEQFHTTDLSQEIERLREPYKSVVKKCLVVNARERIRKASELINHFEGPASAAPAMPSPDGETRVYPKGDPTAPRDDDATKVYPKVGEPGAASRADADATKVYGDMPGTPDQAEQNVQGTPRRMGVLVAVIAGLVLLLGAGGWYMSKQHAAAETAEMRPGKVFRDCADCPEMVIVPAGSFEMGSNENFTGDAELDKYYKPVHTVSIGKPFALGKTEVTQGQWKAVMGSNPSHNAGCGDTCPVENVFWNDAKEFIQKLNAKTGKSYHLPSEAEWEYACRAGGTHAYCGSDDIDSVAWYDSNSGKKTHAVATKRPNAWGLYDMSGNVAEWTEDCFNGSYSGAPTDGTVWSSGNCGWRQIRGGSGDGAPHESRAAMRFGIGNQDHRDDSFGFRVARTVP
jgi:formylglycine-generating enzyme required for sulfatase activity/tRNA A-37 threonylcarbamoyl transferase component Bud32